jgi:hypothetical protein
MKLLNCGPGMDTTAIHDDTAAEINAVTEKTTPVAADLLLAEDSAASNAKKKVQAGNLVKSLDISALTADASPDSAADYVVTLDASDSANKKALINTLPNERFVSRGDPSGYDYTQANLTMDLNWHDLDISSKITSGATRAKINVIIVDAAAKSISFRKKGNSNAYNVDRVATPGGAAAYSKVMEIECDSNGVIQYYSSAAVTSVGITVLGSWVS